MLLCMLAISVRNLREVAIGHADYLVFVVARDIFWYFDVIWRFFVLFGVGMEILCAV